MNEKEDDDISIDFSKVKNFFKKDRSSVEVSKANADGEDVKSDAKENPKDDNEDISIDAKKSKIFGISENSDEEFSIDFGKIKSFFKSEKEGKKSHETSQSKDDEDLSIDFSKVKNIFRSRQKEKSNDDLDFDWGKAKDFFVKYGIVFLALIPVILSIYVRMQADSLAFTDNWARDTVINSIRSQIRNDISQQFPNLPDSSKNVRIEAELQNQLNSNKA